MGGGCRVQKTAPRRPQQSARYYYRKAKRKFALIHYVAIYGHMKPKPRIRSTYPEAKAQALALKEDAASVGIECEVVNVREAKDQLSSLLDRAARGAQIIVTSDGRPKAMIVRFRPVVRGSKWKSLQSFRETMPLSSDSTPLIRELRDDGY